MSSFASVTRDPCTEGHDALPPHVAPADGLRNERRLLVLQHSTTSIKPRTIRLRHTACCLQREETSQLTAPGRSQIARPHSPCTTHLGLPHYPSAFAPGTLISLGSYTGGGCDSAPAGSAASAVGLKRASSSSKPHRQQDWRHGGLQFGEQPWTGGGERVSGAGECAQTRDERPIHEKNYARVAARVSEERGNKRQWLTIESQITSIVGAGSGCVTNLRAEGEELHAAVAAVHGVGEPLGTSHSISSTLLVQDVRGWNNLNHT